MPPRARRRLPENRTKPVDQPPSYCCCKEALEMDPGEVLRCWRYWCCCHRYRTAAPNRASIAINYLRYYYNYLFLYWDYDRVGNATVRWKPTNVDGRNYCYYYYCWRAGDVAADGDFRAEGRVPALGDARRAEVPLNAALVRQVTAGERAAAVEEVDAGDLERIPGVAEGVRDPLKWAVVPELRMLPGLRPNCCRCCWCWG